MNISHRPSYIILVAPHSKCQFCTDGNSQTFKVHFVEMYKIKMGLNNGNVDIVRGYIIVSECSGPHSRSQKGTLSNPVRKQHESFQHD